MVNLRTIAFRLVCWRVITLLMALISTNGGFGCPLSRLSASHFPEPNKPSRPKYKKKRVLSFLVNQTNYQIDLTDKRVFRNDEEITMSGEQVSVLRKLAQAHGHALSIGELRWKRGILEGDMRDVIRQVIELTKEGDRPIIVPVREQWFRLVESEEQKASRQASKGARGKSVYHYNTGFSDFLVDEQAREIELDGRRLNLAEEEYFLLKRLLDEPGHALAFNYIIRSGLSVVHPTDAPSLRALCESLNLKMNPEVRLIEEIPFFGYRLFESPAHRAQRRERTLSKSSPEIVIKRYGEHTFLTDWYRRSIEMDGRELRLSDSMFRVMAHLVKEGKVTDSDWAKERRIWVGGASSSDPEAPEDLTAVHELLKLALPNQMPIELTPTMIRLCLAPPLVP